MSEGRLGGLERRAMLELWTGRCGWCDSRLYFAEMEADHLLAKTLTSDEFAAAFKYFEIDAAKFDVHALPNRAPLCGPLCNRRKSNTPLSHTKSSEELVRKAEELAPKIASRAALYGTADEVGKAAVVLRAALDDGRIAQLGHLPLSDALELMIKQGVDAPAWLLGSTGRPYTRYSRVSYLGFGGDVFSRALWLVEPPAMQPVAVVVEYADDEGPTIQNAAESIAAAVAVMHPDHISVLHYDEPGTPWGRFFMPVPRVEGQFVFGEALREHPEVVLTLAAAEIRSPEGYTNDSPHGERLGG